MVLAPGGAARHVWIYVHERVVGASLDKDLPFELREERTRREAMAGPSQLVRYALPLEVLERWTMEVLGKRRRSLLRDVV